MDAELAKALPSLPGDYYWRVRAGGISNFYYLRLKKRFVFMGMVWFSRTIGEEPIVTGYGHQGDIHSFTTKAQRILSNTIERTDKSGSYSGRY